MAGATKHFEAALRSDDKRSVDTNDAYSFFATWYVTAAQLEMID
jgi:hypothetical protein